MKKNRVIASLIINHSLTNGPTIRVAKIELTYNNEFLSVVTPDIASADCNQLVKKILQGSGVFKQLSCCKLTLNKNSGCRGDIYFNVERHQQLNGLPNAIGEYWCKKITGGIGSYHKFDLEPLQRLPFEITRPHLSLQKGQSRQLALENKIKLSKGNGND